MKRSPNVHNKVLLLEAMHERDVAQEAWSAALSRVAVASDDAERPYYPRRRRS